MVLLFIITYLIYQQSHFTEDDSMLDQLSFRDNEIFLFQVAERIEISDRVSSFIKRLKEDPGKAKLFLE